MGLGVDLDRGAAIYGRKEGSVVGNGAWCYTAWRGPTEGVRQGPVEEARQGLTEGARLRWQRSGRWGRRGDRPRNFS